MVLLFPICLFFSCCFFFKLMGLLVPLLQREIASWSFLPGNDFSLCNVQNMCRILFFTSIEECPDPGNGPQSGQILLLFLVVRYRLLNSLSVLLFLKSFLRSLDKEYVKVFRFRGQMQSQAASLYFYYIEEGFWQMPLVLQLWEKLYMLKFPSLYIS